MMLGDARLAVEDGVDLVVGYVEPHGRGPTEERARGLERAPTIAYREGSRAETEPDVEWLIQRRPSVALVDELAHTNATGAARAKRYEDVERLLGLGHRRLDDRQRPARREPARARAGPDGRRRARDLPRPHPARGRRDPARRPQPRRAARAHRARPGLRRRAGRPGADGLLHGREPDGAAGARAARARRGGRGAGARGATRRRRAAERARAGRDRRPARLDDPSHPRRRAARAAQRRRALRARRGARGRPRSRRRRRRSSTRPSG